MTPRRLSLVLLVAALAAGCVAPPPAKVATVNASEGIIVRPPAPGYATVTLTGVVTAPASVVAAGGGNVVAAGGGNVVAAGGGNVIAAGGGNYRALALEEAPLADAEVYLADAAGVAVAKLPRVRTNAEGRYRIERVPSGFTFKVVAVAKTTDGKDVALQTIIKAAEKAATAEINAASTMVAETVTESREGLLGSFDPATFATAVAETKAHVQEAELPADWSDRAAIRQQMRQLAKRLNKLQQAVDTLSVDLARATARSADLEAALDALRPESPAPSASPSSAGPIAEPSGSAASPTPAPTPIAATVVLSEAGALNGPRGLAIDAKGQVWIADQSGDRLRMLDARGSLATFLESRTAIFSGATGVAFDSRQNMYVSVRGGRDKILKITPAGAVSTFAGGQAGYVDGAATEAQFRNPGGLAIDAADNVYVADTGNHCIRVISPEGRVRTLAGKPETGLVDGAGTSARFNSPRGLDVDNRGLVWVADGQNHAIRRISLEGVVRTVAGTGLAGARDGAAARAGLNGPSDVLFEAGKLWIADSGNGKLRQLTLATDRLETIALSERVQTPYGLEKDAQGRFWLTDTATNRLLRFQP